MTCGKLLLAIFSEVTSEGLCADKNELLHTQRGKVIYIPASYFFLSIMYYYAQSVSKKREYNCKFYCNISLINKILKKLKKKLYV